jgi:hypothetical protein
LRFLGERRGSSIGEKLLDDVEGSLDVPHAAVTGHSSRLIKQRGNDVGTGERHLST